MFWIGSFAMVFSMMMISLCKKYWQFVLAQGILLGLSMTLLTCPAVALSSQYFKKNRAFAVGITIGGSSLGGVIWPILIHELLQRPNVGFGWTMRIAGFVMLPLLGIASFIARPAPPPATSRSSMDIEKRQTAPATRSRWDWSICRTSTMLITASAFFLVYFGMFAPFFLVTTYAVEKVSRPISRSI
jgi:MFS family permease